ncbi:hypothetical protein LTR84_004409 [Exophiala bonariae]|uniref:CENP-V/GFA domain-containing protein n=1 Tax=Exophiala bonariae TaxID=1690606 RepID=A0AAV9N4J7_9EURO|nr:hypothetical protein LTR84_004409 [Exophiala bonariae]
MSRLRPIHGACNCGRNVYSITVPQDALERAEVYFDGSSESRRSQATPLTAWLRIPLPWFSSSTQALFSDETHSSIRKVFSPLHAPHSKRVFCGYCGTHLSYWTEQPASEAEYLSVTLGSLSTEDLEALHELDILPSDTDAESAPSSEMQQTHQGTVSGEESNSQLITRSQRSGTTEGLSWFEELLEGSRLGRGQRTRRGQGVSADGSTRVEWEVSEYFDGGIEEPDAKQSTTASSKRKLDEVVEGDDVNMRG